jgi:hypothetical protein
VQVFFHKSMLITHSRSHILRTVPSLTTLTQKCEFQNRAIKKESMCVTHPHLPSQFLDLVYSCLLFVLYRI